METKDNPEMNPNKKDFDHRFDHPKTKEIEAKIKLLTKEQRDTFNSLVRLGDSKELALSTALNEKAYSPELYEMAYYS